jgi:hypothetical protein
VVAHEVADPDRAHLAVGQQRLQRRIHGDRPVEAVWGRLVQDEQVELVDDELADRLDCVEPAGGEHEAPDHKAAGYAEQTGDERQSGHVRSFVVLRPRQPAGRRHSRPAATGVMPCDGAWPLSNVDLFQRWVGAGKRS